LCAAALQITAFYPGYVTHDSAYQWWQGRHDEITTLWPPGMALFLGLFDPKTWSRPRRFFCAALRDVLVLCGVSFDATAYVYSSRECRVGVLRFADNGDLFTARLERRGIGRLVALCIARVGVCRARAVVEICHHRGLSGLQCGTSFVCAGAA
jgi:hypothetical protein